MVHSIDPRQQVEAREAAPEPCGPSETRRPRRSARVVKVLSARTSRCSSDTWVRASGAALLQHARQLPGLPQVGAASRPACQHQLLHRTPTAHSGLKRTTDVSMGMEIDWIHRRPHRTRSLRGPARR
ncbi:hypothetical protein SAMN06264364_101477 [Quadrisphaera granulorum]|uniref:Uncharacterized protein n=1 Tax=Quadrisphaera granulorum TaxID=317664 RepID=A0A316AGT8_9ACTN|nr:hypothetical protein [Quadrisphaera granulorum]PWJ56499.1 hypothetical protein BXY45_101477 [Quadrisphaera granulorum]SZE95133.1 hypothetical protein SAMN06264364_101477 [Quadrisphaera granulorum]